MNAIEIALKRIKQKKGTELHIESSLKAINEGKSQHSILNKRYVLAAELHDQGK